MPAVCTIPESHCLPLRRAWLVLLFLVLLPSPSQLRADEACQWQATPGLALLAIHQLDSTLGDIGASNKAIANEWLKAKYDTTTDPSPDSNTPRHLFLDYAGVRLFRSWPGAVDTVPPYRSDHVAWYAYAPADSQMAGESARLAVFKQLEPVLRVVNQTFGLTWTYITTADDWMMLYPFLTPDEAKNNRAPSKQVYYTAADFDNRAAGWTRPYLDLVGAGMMVTAAYPVYDGDKLLGVVSQDITLKKLSGGILHSFAGDHCTAWLVDSTGIAIASSDPNLEKEIEQVNSTPGTGGLYYLAEPALKALGNDQAIASSDNRINLITSRVLDETARGGETIFTTTWDDSNVIATRSSQTGWWLILLGQ